MPIPAAGVQAALRSHPGFRSRVFRSRFKMRVACAPVWQRPRFGNTLKVLADQQNKVFKIFAEMKSGLPPQCSPMVRPWVSDKTPKGGDRLLDMHCAPLEWTGAVLIRVTMVNEVNSFLSGGTPEVVLPDWVGGSGCWQSLHPFAFI